MACMIALADSYSYACLILCFLEDMPAMPPPVSSRMETANENDGNDTSIDSLPVPKLPLVRFLCMCISPSASSTLQLSNFDSIMLLLFMACICLLVLLCVISFVLLPLLTVYLGCFVETAYDQIRLRVEYPPHSATINPTRFGQVRSPHTSRRNKQDHIATLCRHC